MRSSTRVTYNKDVPHKGIGWNHDSALHIEEYPGELSKSWWVRELPSLILLLVMSYYIGNIFGPAFFIFLIAVISPFFMWAGFVWLLDHQYH